MPIPAIPRDMAPRLLRAFLEEQKGTRELRHLPPELIEALLTPTVQKALRNAGSGWRQDDVHIRVGGGEPLILEHAAFKQIYVTVNGPVFLLRCLELAQSNENGDPLQIADAAAYSLVRLWAGHYDYCPFDLWRHLRLCDAAARGAYGHFWLSPPEQRLAVAVAGFFERGVVTRVLTEQEGARCAAGLVYEQRINRRPYDLLANLFFRSQCLLAPQVWNNHLKACGIPADPLAESLLPSVLCLVFGVRARIIRQRWRLRRIPGQQPQYWQWPERVADLAKLLIPYLQEGSPSEHSGPDAFPSVCGDHPDANGSPHAQQLPGHVGNPLTMETGDQPAASSSGLGGTAAGTETGRGLDCRSLAAYYRERAGELVVEAGGSADEPSRRPESLRVGFIHDEPASLLALISEEIVWFKSRMRRVNGRNEICLYKRTDPLLVPTGDEEASATRAPNLLLLVDSSSSMGFKPNATDPDKRGKFDTVLRACFGIFNHIERNKLGQNVQVACINFSGRSLASGWHSFGKLDPVEKVLLNYQGGGTTLAPQAIRQAFDSRPGSFLAVCITDGCISNVAAAATELRKVVVAKCEFVLIHVGDPNSFTKAVQEMGCPVHIVQAAQELVGQTLGVVRNSFRRSSARGARRSDNHTGS